MKILVLRNAWRGQDYGGAEELALDLVKELNNQKHEAFIVSGTEAVAEKAKGQNAPFIRGPYSKRQILTKHRFPFLPIYLLDLQKATKAYLQIFKDFKPDLIHATGQQDSIAATKAAGELKIPIIWSDHGELKNSLKKSIMPPWGVPGVLLKRRLGQISALCMVNAEDIDTVRRYAPDAPIKIVPNGVVDKNPDRRQRTTENHIVYESRIIKEKGIFELLEAFKELTATHPEQKLTIAGSGPSEEEAKLYVADNNLQGIVGFVGFVEAAMKDSSIFVLPTYTEAQSLAILKAMMYQKPILTTNIKGNTHFLKNNDNALLVKPQDPKALLEGLQKLVENKKIRDKLAKNARDYYEKHHKLEAVVSEYYTPLYEKVIRQT